MAVFRQTLRQFCVGSLLKQGLLPKDHERLCQTSGDYVMENYFLCDRPDDLLVLDTKAGTDKNVGNDRFKTIDHPSKPDVLVRLVKVYKDKTADMTTFNLYLRDQNGDQEKFQLHRLVNINIEHHGRGLRFWGPLREYLELEDGKSFEDVPRFQYNLGNTEKSIQAIKAKVKRLKRKGRCPRKNAKWCDIDHLVGRSKVWMNNSIFTISCSHSWNRSMAYIRYLFGDWGYACSAYLEYGSGND